MIERRPALAVRLTSEPAPPATQRETPSLAETLPPYVVVLHNDDVNSMDHVVHALLVSVPELDLQQAVDVMLTAHQRGEANVVTCPLERAELYRDRLESHGLTATIERAR
jgi:ATP-dependent Clp protease adaptor protein ClpS